MTICLRRRVAYKPRTTPGQSGIGRQEPAQRSNRQDGSTADYEDDG